MYIVDRLNRKYEQLTAGVEEENLGPLEVLKMFERREMNCKRVIDLEEVLSQLFYVVLPFRRPQSKIWASQ